MSDCKHEKVLEWGEHRPDQCADCYEEMPLPYIDNLKRLLEGIAEGEKWKVHAVCVSIGLFQRGKEISPHEQEVAKKLLTQL